MQPQDQQKLSESEQYAADEIERLVNRHSAEDFEGLTTRELEAELAASQKELKELQETVPARLEKVLEDDPSRAEAFAGWRNRVAGSIDNAQIKHLQKKLEAKEGQLATEKQLRQEDRVEFEKKIKDLKDKGDAEHKSVLMERLAEK